jgi:hypothetical protein
LPQIEPIIRPQDVDVAWLSQLLGKAVAGVTSNPVGTGKVGATFRFDLDYADMQPDQPRSLIGKFMSDDPISRATGIAQLSYLREVNFYRQYGGANSLPIARIKFSALNESTHEFALIMDDFPHHRSGNQLEPATLLEAELAVTAAAKIHAPFWGDEELDSHYWLNGSKAAPVMNVDGLYNMLWPAFCARYKDRINNKIIAAGESYLGRLNDWIWRRTGTRCLTHGDFRPDNMLFLESDRDTPIIIVDWQTAGVGNGATDIAYYMGTALAPDMRRQTERALVDRWIEELLAQGVPKGDTSALWDVYRRDAVAGFLMGVLASMIVVQTPRGDTMFLEMCARSAEMIHDHGSVRMI